MKAKCVCPAHGQLPMEQITIRNGNPVCGKCHAPLDFGDMRPRKVKK